MFYDMHLHETVKAPIQWPQAGAEKRDYDAAFGRRTVERLEPDRACMFFEDCKNGLMMDSVPR